MTLAERFSTDTEGIALCMGLQAEANVGLAEIAAAIESKISEATLFKISGQADVGRNI